MKALMFPGQGSQQPGMGNDLFSRYPEWTEAAEAILDMPIREICLSGSPEDLRPTQVCQPALFVVNAMAYRARCDENGGGPNDRIDFLVGHSLGEYNALLAAGVFDFETGVGIVKLRGELMASQSENGLAAILGLDRSGVQAVLDESCYEDLWIANDNADTQQVIGGSTASLEAAEELFLDNYAFKYIHLPVSNAFHTPLLKRQSKAFGDHLRTLPLAPPKIPVIANVTARRHSAETLIDNLTRHFHSPVLFADTIRAVRAEGVTEFEEIGGTSVLLDLIKYIQ